MKTMYKPRQDLSIHLMEDIMIIPLPKDFCEDFYGGYVQQISLFIESNDVFGVLIDLNALQIVDASVLVTLNKINKLLKLMGIEVGWIGLKPSVIVSFFDNDNSYFDKNVSYNITLTDGVKNLNSKRQ